MNDFFNFDEINEKLNFLRSDQTKKLGKWIYSLSPYQFTTTAFLIGIILAPNFNLNEQVAIGNFLIEIGQVILTVNSRLEASPENQDISNSQAQNLIEQTKSEFNKKLAILQKQINSIKNPK